MMTIDKVISATVRDAGAAAATGASATAMLAEALKASSATWADHGKDTDIGGALWSEFRAAFAEKYANRDGVSDPLRAAVLAWSLRGIPGLTDTDKTAHKDATASAGTIWTRAFTRAFGKKPAAEVEKKKEEKPTVAADTAGEAAVLGPEQAALALAGHYVKDDPDAVKALAHLLLVVASNVKARDTAARAVAKAIK